MPQIAAAVLGRLNIGDYSPLALLAALATDKLGNAGLRHGAIALSIAVAAAAPFIANPRLILGDVTDTNVELASWLDEQ